MTSYNPHIHHRRSIRLKGYDYSHAGLYFITICCQDRAFLFGNVVNGEMMLNDAGNVAMTCWMEIPNHYPNVVLHEMVVMPNHVHGIVEFVGAKYISPEPTTDHNYISPEPSSEINGGKYISSEITMERNEINGENDVLPTNGANDVLPTNGANDVLPINGANDVLPINGANDVLPINGAKNVLPINGAKNVLPINGAKNVLPLRGTSQTVGAVVRGFKIGVTKWMRQNTNIHDVWQRNYHEHIIRDEYSYLRISEYIINNPAKWKEDTFFHKLNG